MKKIYFHLPKIVPTDQLKRAVHALQFFATVLFASIIPSNLFAVGANVSARSSFGPLGGLSITPYATLTNAGTVGNTTTYTATVDAAVASVTVTVNANIGDPVTVNGVAVTRGTASGSIPLGAVGTATTITIVVTDPEGTFTYLLRVGREPANAANLSNLVTSNGTFTSAFTPGTTQYELTSSTGSITVTPTTSDPNATVTVNGIAVTSGTASSSITLPYGDTFINVAVTAQDGITTITYTLIVDRLGGAGLSSIALTPNSRLTNTGTVGNTTTYIATVGSTIASVTVTPTAQDDAATITVNGIAVTTGTASGSIALAAGTSTTINTVVTAGDGTSATKTYSIIVTRPAETDASLSSLESSSGTLTPAFASGTTSYTATVSNATASIFVIPTTSDPAATVKVNGLLVPPGQVFSINLPEGAVTNINAVITAADGTTTKTYSIAVTRAPSANAALSTIALTPYSSLTNTGTVGTTTAYTTSVSNATASVKVTTTTQDANATVKVNGVTVASGTASGSIALAEGTVTTITTVVTAQDGTTTRTYLINVTRGPSSNAALSTIALTPYTSLVNTGTVGSTTTYTTTASSATTSVKVTPTKADPNATIKVNGVTVTSGTASASIALPVGQTTINTVVTAQDGTTTRTYSIKITRLSNNASLTSIALTPYSTLTNGGTTGTTTTYTTSVSNATTSVKVTPTTSDANSKVKVNGVAVTSGTASGSIALAVGSNTITTVVTAQDGTTTRTYLIKVTRATGPLMSLYQPAEPEVSVTKPNDTLTIENDGVMVHQGVSPNGDGINDVLTIDGITAFPNNNLTIIDRSGSLIFQAKGYDNSIKAFDGHSSVNGRMLQSGTYFYSLDYVDDGQSKHKTGYILLKY